MRQLGRRHEEAFRRDGIAFVRRPETRGAAAAAAVGDAAAGGGERGGCETQRRAG